MNALPHGALSSLLLASTCAVAPASAAPPRYIAVEVNALEHVCNPAYPEWFAPVRAYALSNDGRVAGEANCGTTTGGSRPFVTSAAGVVTEYPHGTFMFTKPAGFLANTDVMMVGDWCPMQTGTCTTALAIGGADGSFEDFAASSVASSIVSDTNEQGWATGWGGASPSGGWRLRPDGTFEELVLTSGWGLSVEAISNAGIVAGSAYINNQQRAVAWSASGVQVVLPAIERGTSGSASGVGMDGSIVGSSNGRAAWWRLGTIAMELLPIGTASNASKMAGNPMGADPLGFAIFGTHQNETRLFRAQNANNWTDLGPTATGGALTNITVVSAPRPDFMVAVGLTAMYEQVTLIWSLDAGLHRLSNVLVNPPAGGAANALAAVDANLSRTILANAGFNGRPYLLHRLDDGDTNGDHAVNGADLAVVLSSWGSVPAGTRAAADFDGDGAVNGSDLAAVLALWN